MIRKSPLIIIVAVLLTALFVWWQAPGTPTTATPDAAPGFSATQQGVALNTLPPGTLITGTENLPASVDGTEVDGGFEVDKHGNLIPSLRTRELFDYFLALRGEETLEQIVARLHAYIRHHLPPPADQQAIVLLGDYLGYLGAVADAPAPTTSLHELDATTLKLHHSALAALRDQHFDPATRAAFFGDEEALDRYTLSRMTLLEDDSLSAGEQAERLALLQEQLPDTLREPIREAARLQDLRAISSRIQNEQGSAAELRLVREQLVGTEAADRLEALDAERAAWQRRMDDWLAERQRLLSQSGLGEADLDALIDRARSARFSEQEIVRVRALEETGG